MIYKDWLARQREYQSRTFGVDYDEMWRDPAAKTQTRYVTEMLNAAFLELAEAQQETPWKSWTTVDRREVWDRNRDRIAGELVDVLFFVANALAAIGVSDARLRELYAAKMTVNETRQAEGYDGFTTKCPQCQRALDEPGALPIAGADGRSYCSTLCMTVAGAASSVNLANPQRTTVTYTGGDGETSCARCGYTWGPFELYAIGLDDRRYCGTEHAIDSTGGQRDLEDVDR